VLQWLSFQRKHLQPCPYVSWSKLAAVFAVACSFHWQSAYCVFKRDPETAVTGNIINEITCKKKSIKNDVSPSKRSVRLRSLCVWKCLTNFKRLWLKIQWRFLVEARETTCKQCCQQFLQRIYQILSKNIPNIYQIYPWQKNWNVMLLLPCFYDFTYMINSCCCTVTS